MSEYMIIDGIKAEINGEKNILELARKVGIEIPAFCYDPELSIYGMTKAAQFKMVKNFAGALAPFGVTVNNIAPGVIETPRNDDVNNDPQKKSAIERLIPCGRFGKPSDISPAVLLLCSDEGAYITGSEITIDGGFSLR